jgi:hypothetical protein
MAHAQKPDFILQWNGRVHVTVGVTVQSTAGSQGVRISWQHLYWSAVVWRLLATHSLLVSPSLSLPRVTLRHVILIGPYRRFGGACCLSVQGTSSQKKGIKIRAANCSETCITIYQSACCCIPCDLNLTNTVVRTSNVSQATRVSSILFVTKCSKATPDTHIHTHTHTHTNTKYSHDNKLISDCNFVTQNF